MKEELFQKPIFCFTSDIDWAPEPVIKDTLKMFEGIPLTPFVTHHSEVIKKHYNGKYSKYVGLHPNFRLGSTHGTNFKEIILNVIDLWKDAICFRAHSFFDNSLITQEFYDRGFKYDSNLCLHLQPNLIPLKHSSGLLRFPVFLEDDYYAKREQVWDLSHIIDILETPGLKIFNFHPIHIALNTPNLDYHENVKKVITDENWKSLVYKGKGTRTFLIELLQFIKKNPGLGIFYLDDLYSLVTDTLFKKYDFLSEEKRAQFVQNRYEILNGDDIYATSRDFNLRELEIEFIINNIYEDARILDIGCGNGYTDIRIAQATKAEIIGIDFSKKMIKSANNLKEKFKDELISIPIFQLGDVRELDWEEGFFDIVISERCLLNLPNRDAQYKTIREVYRVLKKDGIYIMVEGTRNGLRRLNDMRVKFGLDPILDRGGDNVSSLKFEEEDIDKFLLSYFKIIKEQYFGMYYLISRVVHPLLVSPNQPKFDAKINSIARKIASYEPDYKRLGHIRGLVLEAIKK